MVGDRRLSISKNEWEWTQQQIAKLRQQNAQLKSKISALEPCPIATGVIRQRHSLTQSHVNFNKQNGSEELDVKNKFKVEMEEWARKIDARYSSKFGKKGNRKGSFQGDLQHKCRSDKDLLRGSINSNKGRDSKQEKDRKKLRESINNLKQMELIQSICLYGPDEKSLYEQIGNRRMFVTNQLLYSSSEDVANFKIYGEYFYPEGLVGSKNLKQEEAPTQVNQMIFKKNTKKQDCNLFLFMGDPNNEQLKKQNAVLDRVNPGRWLSVFFVQFSDFQIMQAEASPQEIQDKMNKTMDVGTENRKRVISQNQDSDRVGQQTKMSNHYLKSKYTLSIFTYFPFINVMEQLLSCILDDIKIKRVEHYSQNNKVPQVTIKFFTQELKRIGKQINNQLTTSQLAFQKLVNVNFGNFMIDFSLKQSKIDQLLFSGWVYDTIKVFDKEVLYDLYTNMMTEQSICFVSENTHLLSYVVFLFVCILPFPFTYPYPCISQVFRYQLLESPFVVVVGINQSSKWLQENVCLYPKKIFVDLNQEEPKIKGKKKTRSVKSERLRKIFNQLYKRIQNANSPVPTIFKKKGTIIRPATKQQNESSFQFVRSLQNYYNEQIFSHLPNPAIISFIKDRSDDHNETSKISNITKEIQKYLKESRKQKEKDQFVQQLIQQQIFYQYIITRYGLLQL